MVTQYKFIEDMILKMRGTNLEVSYNHYIDTLDDFNELISMLSHNGVLCKDRYYKGVMDEVIYYLPKERLKTQEDIELISPFPRFNGDLTPMESLNYHRVNISLKFTDEGEIFVNIRPFIFGDFTLIKSLDNLDKSSFDTIINIMLDNFNEYKILVPFEILESNEKSMIGKLTINKYFSLTKNLDKVFDCAVREFVINSNESIRLTF